MKEGQFYKGPNDNTVYKFNNGSLQPLVGSWSEADFKKYAGQSFSSINQVNDINKLPKGQPITQTDLITNNPAEAIGPKIVDPKLLQYYKPADIITQGDNKFLKAGIKPVNGEKLSPNQFTKLQQEYDPKTLENKIVRAGQNIYLRN